MPDPDKGKLPDFDLPHTKPPAPATIAVPDSSNMEQFLNFAKAQWRKAHGQ